MRYLLMLRKILTVDLLIVNTSGQWSDAEQQVEHLLCYIVATCYPKILWHLTNYLSQLYFLSLLSLRESTISFRKPEDCHTPTSTELASDRHLAHFIISLTLPVHKYPDIVTQANSVIKEKDTRLYTECTTKQFHSLLCWLLTFFRDHLNNLKSRNSKKPSSMAILSQFKDCVSLVVMCGYGLQALANSNAWVSALTPIESWHGSL